MRPRGALLRDPCHHAATPLATDSSRERGTGHSSPPSRRAVHSWRAAPLTCRGRHPWCSLWGWRTASLRQIEKRRVSLSGDHAPSLLPGTACTAGHHHYTKLRSKLHATTHNQAIAAATPPRQLRTRYRPQSTQRGEPDESGSPQQKTAAPMVPTAHCLQGVQDQAVPAGHAVIG